MERFTRTHAADIELRANGDGRTITGIAVPFNTVARIGGQHGFDEQFRRGAFTRTITERGDRLKLLANHNADAFPVGKLTLLREDAAGLYIEARVSQTAAGDEVLTLVKGGEVDSFSIGFAPVKDDWNPDRTAVTRTEVRLLEVSAVAFPAYDTARIANVRTDTRTIPASHDPLVWSFNFTPQRNPNVR